MSAVTFNIAGDSGDLYARRYPTAILTLSGNLVNSKLQHIYGEKCVRKIDQPVLSLRLPIFSGQVGCESKRVTSGCLIKWYILYYVLL